MKKQIILDEHERQVLFESCDILNKIRDTLHEYDSCIPEINSNAVIADMHDLIFEIFEYDIKEIRD